ncbi:galactokinase [uncultured Jatrophihabitans sp.]|uniref:galactokinase n=1 Tax=uncultured Jatrophihabitans sp. TaxID=1610747 RepID=UPI0035CBAD3F
MVEQAAVTWRAPGRVNLIGEHTDYNDGFVLPFALPVGVTARVSLHDNGTLTITSTAHGDEPVTLELDDLVPEERDGWSTYVEGVVWEMRRRGSALRGADIALDADLVAGSGLSSSGALTCAVAGAVGDALDAPLDPQTIVAVAHAAENDYVGVPTGTLDQNAIVRARAGHALFLDTRTMESRQVPLRLAEHDVVVLVIDTQAPHRLADGEYAKRREECNRAAQELGVDALRDVSADDLDDALSRLDDDVLRRRVRHVVTEDARVLDTVRLLDADDVRGIGPLLTASHVSLRDDYEVSAPGLDLAVDTALAQGAHGARMTGGGFGGSAIALIDADAVDTVRAAVQRAFADAGMNAPHVFTAEPADGAHRVD